MSPLHAPRPWLMLAAGLLALGLLMLLLDRSSRPVREAAALASAPPVPTAPLGQPAAGAGPRAVDAPAAAAAPAAAEAVPPGVNGEQWQQAQQALADHPQRQAELARLAGYLSFQNRFARFQALRQQPGGAPGELQALARELDAALPERLARREMGAGEARLLKLALLQVLQPDEALRQAALAAWEQAQQALAGSTADPREAAWRQQSDAAVAAWQALPESRRDPKALEARLDALRESIFGR